jgi:hypothetical protein
MKGNMELIYNMEGAIDLIEYAIVQEKNNVYSLSRISTGAMSGQSLDPIGLCSSAALRVLVSCASGRLHDGGGIAGFRARRTVLEPQFQTSKEHPSYIHGCPPTCHCNVDIPRLPVPRYTPTREPASQLHKCQVSRKPHHSRTESRLSIVISFRTT